MRSARKRRSGFPQGNQLPHGALHQVKFRNRRPIPQRNKSPLSILCHHSGIPHRSMNALVRGKIKPIPHFPPSTPHQPTPLLPLTPHPPPPLSSSPPHPL